MQPGTNGDKARAADIVAAYAGIEGAMLPLLHAIQKELGWIPDDVIPVIADGLNLTRAEVFGIVTFYHDFRRAPPGRRVLRLCRAEACQSMGGAGMAERLLRRLGIGWGGTTPDGALTVESVYCLGLCACAPAALLDDEPVGRLDDAALEALHP
jgi:formate dehydrogenase subunit gamma